MDRNIIIILISITFLTACHTFKKKHFGGDKGYKVKTTAVNKATDVLNALDLNCNIELNSGLYNLNELNDEDSSKYFYWSSYIEGHKYIEKNMLVFRNMNNIKLIGKGERASDTKVFSENSEAIVLIFENCKNVEIDNVWLGHITQSKSCFGGVLSFINCGSVRMNNTDMFGTGFYGFETYNTDSVFVNNSKIWDCSGSIFSMYNGTYGEIKNSKFYDNVSDSHFSHIEKFDKVKIDSCAWFDNRIEDSVLKNQALFFLYETSVEIKNSSFTGNRLESFIKKKKDTEYTSDNLLIENNTIKNEFEHEYE